MDLKAIFEFFTGPAVTAAALYAVAIAAMSVPKAPNFLWARAFFLFAGVVIAFSGFYWAAKVSVPIAPRIGIAAFVMVAAAALSWAGLRWAGDGEKRHSTSVDDRPPRFGTKVGKDVTTFGDVSHFSEIGDGSTIVGATNARRDTILNTPMTIGRGAQGAPGSVVIGAGAGGGRTGLSNSEEDRRALLDRIILLYINSHDGISTRMMSGLELPPVDFINAELARQGANWRVRRTNGGVAEIYEVEA